MIKLKVVSKEDCIKNINIYSMLYDGAAENKFCRFFKIVNHNLKPHGLYWNASKGLLEWVADLNEKDAEEIFKNEISIAEKKLEVWENKIEGISIISFICFWGLSGYFFGAVYDQTHGVVAFVSGIIALLISLSIFAFVLIVPLVENIIGFLFESDLTKS